jgi:hypothetical protein
VQLALASNISDEIAIIQPNEAIRRWNSLFKTEHAKWRKVVYNNSTLPPTSVAAHPQPGTTSAASWLSSIGRA